MKGTQTGRADFTQVVTSPPKDGQAARSKTSSGTFEFQRTVSRLHEMQAAGWSGDFVGFLAFLRTDPQFYATSRCGCTTWI